MDRAGVGPRAIAVLIDSFLFFILACCLIFIIALASGGDIEDTGTSGTEILLNMVIGLLYYGYFIVMEGNSGTTLGKRIMKLRVVRVDGTPISMRDSVVRNLLRIVDGFFFYLVGAIVIWTSPDKQRLGDRVAKTIVVSSTPQTVIEDAPWPEQRF